MKTARVVVLFILFAVISANVLGASVEWRTVRTEHFIVYHAEGDRETARRAGDIGEEWYRTLSGKFGFDPGGATPIYLYPDRRSFGEATGVEPSDTVVGLAHSHLRDIEVDASGAMEDISRIIPHELVHIFLSRKLRANYMRLPVWGHEGIAKYFADDWSPDDGELLIEAVSRGEIMLLSDITLSFPADKRARSIAYVQSYSLIQFIADKYTEESITDLLTALEEGELFDSALFHSIGVYPDRLEADWRQYAAEKYRANRWHDILTTLGAAAMAILAILAFRARRIQARRKDWEPDEMPSEDQG